jgi:hypothetical protein
MRLASLTLALVAVSQLGATDCGEIIADPGFDHWCGEQLCYWKLERGEIRRVPTWRAGDDGAELVGDDVAIAQLTAVTSIDTDCIRFEMLADIDETAEVRLEADVFDDGTVDWSERVPTADWERVTMRIGLRGSYEGIKFRITKVGDGHATVAQMAAEVAPDDEPCPSFVDVGPRPLGARCAGGDDCGSGVCNAGVCSTCGSDADCGADVCGREDGAPGSRQDWHTCVAPASRELAELCFTDAECATGICNGTLCSECRDATSCGASGYCETMAPLPVELCMPRAAPAGNLCVFDDQCVSPGGCVGAPLGVCRDWPLSIPCYDDGQCPVYGDGSPGECDLIAVSGGTCQ